MNIASSMTNLYVFGEKVQLSPEGFSGSLGGMNNTLVITMQKMGVNTLLACDFKGDLPLGKLENTSWNMECSIKDGAFVALKVELKSGGTLQVDDLGFPARETEVNEASLSRRPGHSVMFGTDRNMFRSLISKMTGGSVVRVDQSSHANEEFFIAPDFHFRAFTFEPKRSETRVTVKHYYECLGGRFESEQRVPIAAARVMSDSVLLQGCTDRLYVHGDLINKRPSIAENQVFFQHALVNGELHLTAQLTQLRDLTLNWAAQEGSASPPVLLALRWRDENGHPLAFQPTDGAFSLMERFGFSDVPDGGSSSIEWTNQTVGVTSDLVQSWTLRAIDPLAHYRQNDNLHGEYGPVKLARNAPQEIHGLASGVMLQVPLRGAEDGMLCEFSCKKVEHGGQILASLPEIKLGGNGPDWVFRAFLEERDSRVDSTLSAREAPGKTGEHGPVLPLIDPQPMVVNLHPTGGETAYQGYIVQALNSWLGIHDQQFVGATPQWIDRPPALSAGPQVHRTGFALMPGTEQISRVLAQFRTAGSLDDLIPVELRLNAPSAVAVNFYEATATPVTGYMHGIEVDADFGAKIQTIEDRLAKTPIWNEAWVRVMNHWVAPPAALIAVFDELRRLLNVTSSLPEPLEAEWGNDDLIQDWIDLKLRASEMAAMGDFDDIDVLESDTLSDVLESMDVDEFAELCLEAIQGDTEAIDAPFLPLVRWLDAPMGPDMFRRVVRLLLDANVQPTVDRFKPLRQACEAANLQFSDFVTNLLGVDFLKAVQEGDLLAKNAKENLQGILTDLGLGEVELLRQVRDAWETNTSKAFDTLKRRWGPVLSDDLLDRIAADASEARALLDALSRDGIAIQDLADVIRRPPEYLFATRRFASVGDEWDKALRLWSGRFGLANLAQGIDWHFFLGDASTLIVKLSDRRSVEDILRETHERFSTSDRDDPLGLAHLDPAQANKTFDGGLILLKQKLGPTLLARSWTGLLILRPTADISDDIKMKDLCGLEYIDALFVAVAGRPLKNGGLDVTAAIESCSKDEAVTELKARRPNEWKGDVDFGLTRFSVVIRRSTLDAADIAFQLRVKNLMGKEHPARPGENAQTITIRGTLPPADPANPDKSRDIQFAAVLDPPKSIPIDVLCFKEVLFSGLRIGLRDGRTFLDIDADISLQNVSVPDEGYLDFFESLEQLKLHGFRIALPSLKIGEARAIGESIGLDFEWPSVEFSAPRSRAIKLFGLEIKPLALGILRQAGEDWERFKEKFLNVENWDLPDLGVLKTEVPFIRFRAAFGSLPALGVSGKLSFDIVFGLLVVNGVPQRPFIAVEGIEGKKITLDLFRLITVTIDELVFKRNWTFKLPLHRDVHASGLIADRVELKVLNWNPLGKGGQLSLASFHRTDGDDEYQRHGFVVGYEKKKANAGTSPKGFVEIHWIVLAQNIELRKEAYDYLLASSLRNVPPTEDTKSLLTGLLVYQDADDENKQLPAPTRKPRELVDGLLGATFTKSPSWLFAISFSLGELLELGNLVLHDQHYYGIRLRDRRWVQVVFGQDTIEFAYIPGTRRELDRFRTNLRIPMFDMLGPMTSGEVALEWAVNWDFLIDIGFPWKTSVGHNWFRAFSLPVGTYEGKFGFYMEKKTTYEVVPDTDVLLLGCGAALYVGIYAGYGNSVAYVRAGIGVFGIFEGRFWLKNTTFSRPETLLKATIVRMEISGTIGIFAYAEGRIEVWIISASFRAWAEASLTTTVIFVPNATCAIAYNVTLAAGYSASVRVGSGLLSWTFSVSGQVDMPVSGRLLLA